jgi:Protein of unknown function (DUF3631)
VAEVAGGDWPKRAREAAAGLSGSGRESDPMESLLGDVAAVFRRLQTDRLLSRELVEGLRQMPGRPWRGLVKSNGVTGLWLAQRLRPLGISPRMMRTGRDSGRGYAREDFKEAFQRYGAEAELRRREEAKG